MEKEKKIDILILIIVIGFSISTFYHYIQGQYLGKSYPQNTFLFLPGDHFMDFFNPVRGSSDLDPFRPDKINYIGGYPPFGYLVAYLLSLIHPWEVSWALLIIVYLISLFFLFWKYLYNGIRKLSSHQLLSIFALTFLTYPVIFAVDRSNFDIIICLFLILIILSYQKKWYLCSAVLLGCATAIKPFVILLIFIFFFEKRYKEILIAIGTTIFMTVLSLAVFNGGFIIELQKYITENTSAVNSITNGTIARFSTDLYDMSIIILTFVLKWFGQSVNLYINAEFHVAYTIFAFVIIICLILYLWKVSQPFWKKVFYLIALGILLPFSSGDYRLTYLLIPLMLFIDNNETKKLDLPIMILWGLLMIPKNYYTIANDQNIGMILNPLLLVGIFALYILDSFILSKQIMKTNVTIAK